MRQDTPTDGIVYKICGLAEWQAALAAGEFRGSADDLRDGFIHLSTADQVDATAKKYFSGQRDLVIVAIDGRRLGTGLRWEPSRGGALFPHVYAALPASAALWVKPLPLDADGRPVVPAELPSC